MPRHGGVHRLLPQLLHLPLQARAVHRGHLRARAMAPPRARLDDAVRRGRPPDETGGVVRAPSDCRHGADLGFGDVLPAALLSYRFAPVSGAAFPLPPCHYRSSPDPALILSCCLWRLIKSITLLALLHQSSTSITMSRPSRQM